MTIDIIRKILAVAIYVYPVALGKSFAALERVRIWWNRKNPLGSKEGLGSRYSSL